MARAGLFMVLFSGTFSSKILTILNRPRYKKRGFFYALTPGKTKRYIKTKHETSGNMSHTQKYSNTPYWLHTAPGNVLPVVFFMESAGHSCFMPDVYKLEIKRLSCFVLQA